MSLSRKKILLSVNTSWNIINFRLNLVKKLQSLGHEVHILCPKDKFTQEIIDLGCIYHPIKMDNKGSNPLKDLRLLCDYYKKISEINPDKVFLFTIKPNIYGSIASSILKVPFINNITGLGTSFLHKGLINKTVVILYRYALKKSQNIFFQNTDDANLFISKKIIKNQKTHILPGSGVDLKKFKPEPLPLKTTFYFISRLLYDKGIRELLSASKNLFAKYGDRFNLIIIGKEEKEQSLGIPIQEIKKLEANGFLKYEGISTDIKKELKKASVVILPSYREGTSRVLLEACAMGRPIITTNVPGCKHLVKNNGWICEARSTISLEKVMESALLSTRNYLEELGENSRNLVEDTFDEKIVIEAYTNEL